MADRKMTKEEILDKLAEITQTLAASSAEIEKVRRAVLTWKPSDESPAKEEWPLSIVPDYETGYTLDDLYTAFGKKRKGYASRLKSALNEKQITTLEKFLSLSIGELLELNNIGYKTLTYTRKALGSLGIKW